MGLRFGYETMDRSLCLEIAVEAIKRDLQSRPATDADEATHSALHLYDAQGRVNLGSELARITRAAMEVLPHRREYGAGFRNQDYRRDVVEIVTQVLFELHGCSKFSARAYMRAWTVMEICWNDIVAVIVELDWRAE